MDTPAPDTPLLAGVREAGGPHSLGAISLSKSLNHNHVVDHIVVVEVVVHSAWITMYDLRLAQLKQNTRYAPRAAFYSTELTFSSWHNSRYMQKVRTCINISSCMYGAVATLQQATQSYRHTRSGGLTATEVRIN